MKPDPKRSRRTTTTTTRPMRRTSPWDWTRPRDESGDCVIRMEEDDSAMESIDTNNRTGTSTSTSTSSMESSTSSSSAMLVYQQVMDEWVKGPGGLLRDDQQHLFGGDDTTTSTSTSSTSSAALLAGLVLRPLVEQQTWLDHVRFARCRAQAWDATHYRQERSVLQAWLNTGTQSKNPHS
jgi:hypothetical protein